MSGLLQHEAAAAPIRRHGADVWHVHGKPFRHSAAKFWSSLLDEVSEDYPACDRLVLESSDGAVFRADQLFPELDLDAAARSADGQSLADCLRSVALEMEVCGYPGAVTIRLFAGEAELLARDLPLDCVDADLMPHLTVWLLEWAGLPESAWNDPVLSGSVAARDRRRGRAYAFDFELLNQPLHEGLCRRRLTLALRPAPAAAGAEEPAP